VQLYVYADIYLHGGHTDDFTLPTVIDADALQIFHPVNLYMFLTACLSEPSSSGLRRKICRTDVLNRDIQKK